MVKFRPILYLGNSIHYGREINPSTNSRLNPRERDPQVAGLKVPPHSIEAEQSVLGGLMLDNERWDDVAERVVADDFYTRPHRHIFTEMARLQESGSPIDLITLAESLERQGATR